MGRIGAQVPDLVILDIGLPDVPGPDLLSRIRQDHAVLCSCRPAPGRTPSGWRGRRLRGQALLPGGAAARVDRLLHPRNGRAVEAADEVLRFDGLEIERRSRECRVRGTAVGLTAKEFDLLAWQDDATVTGHVRRIRRKTEPTRTRPVDDYGLGGPLPLRALIGRGARCRPGAPASGANGLLPDGPASPTMTEEEGGIVKNVRVVGAASVLSVLALLSPMLSHAVAANAPSDRGVGDYIVVLHDSVDSAREVAAEHARTQRAQVRLVYEHALKGYAATLSEQGLRGVVRDPRVDYVERDGPATIAHHACGHDKPSPYSGECGTGTVTGTVTASTGGAISGASVSIDGSSASAITDASGSYSITGAPAGSQTVTATAAGFDPSSRPVDVVMNGTVAGVDFALVASTVVNDPGGCTGAQALPWGIDRVQADVSSTLANSCAGTISNVHVYVIDTGVDVDHPDLTVVNHVNFAGGPNKDCNGHGTHVAGTIAAVDNNQDVVGVAPGAAITGVKVLGCSGSGSWSGVIKGIDFVTGDVNDKKWRAIANMSLSGGASDAVDAAVQRSAAAGVVYSLAAGNSGADACKSSPARAGAGLDNGIITVAATDPADIETSWSNYGGCVDIWAPGLNILSTSRGGGTTTMSGTSMAAPHVGGGAALYLSGQSSAVPGTVEDALTTVADSSKGTTSKDGRVIQVLDVSGF